MEEEILIKSWLVWRETHVHLQADKEVIVGSAVRFPSGYESMLQYLISGSSFMMNASYRKLRKQGILILGEYRERDEHFIMWRYRQQTRMVRMTFRELKGEMQQKMESLLIKAEL
ncbi:hypothetical protein ACQCN2_19890 [Brevibacillus ginsengisoli]|uniref:hypothetical protein n=1 Tax=Brevibacillus ginsengisoli TaxID=363854 RepID=UPI003CEDFCFA